MLELIEALRWHLYADVITAIENKDKVLYDTLFKDIHMWITAKYIELGVD
jgi:hypothetical protein